MDSTEAARRKLVAVINENPKERDALEMEYGRVWDTEELIEDFDVESFLAPFAIVIDKDSENRGTIMFQHAPRYYFKWRPWSPDEEE